MKSLKQFKKLAQKAIEIRNNQELTWEEKYDLVFSEKVIAKISKTGIRFEWYDPDTTYEEGVRAYVDAVERRLNAMKVMSKPDCEVTFRVVERCS